MSTMKQHLTGSAAFTGAVVIGAALGIGGASLALWSDAEEVSGQIGSGYEYFAAGAPGTELIPAIDGQAGFEIDGQEVAAHLLEHGGTAIPIQVDSLSQGNKGLQYELTEPDWGEGILGQADVTVFWVETADECVPGATPGAPPGHVDGYTSTPVLADYTHTDVATTEYWCLQATLDGLEDEGTYTNVGSVTAADPDGQEVGADDEWSATVITGLDPAAEADRTIAFAYSTFRPGETP